MTQDDNYNPAAKTPPDNPKPGDKPNDNAEKPKTLTKIGDAIKSAYHDKQTRKHEKARTKQAKRDAKATGKTTMRHIRLTAAVTGKSVIAMIALLGGLAVVAAVNCALSFNGLYHFGRDVSQLPWLLPAFVPTGVDGLTIVATGAIYLLRHAPWHVKVYCWIVYAVPMVLSIAGNVIDAKAQGLTAEGVAAAAVWPVLLALAVHLIVVVMRYLEISEGILTTTAKTSDQVDDNATSPVSFVVVDDRPLSPEPDNVLDRDLVEMRARQGVSNDDIRKELTELGRDIEKIGNRNIQRWAKDTRDNMKKETA